MNTCFAKFGETVQLNIYLSLWWAIKHNYIRCHVHNVITHQMLTIRNYTFSRLRSAKAT